MTESTQKCHPERSAKHVVEGSQAAVLVAILLAACGENTATEKIVEVATGGTEIVSSVKDLAKCSKDNQGERVWVKDESADRVCVDGKWFATKESAKDTVFMAGDTVYLDNGNYSCTTKDLKDKSGLKIICNGDSIGVVLNGVNGKDGEKGDAGKDGEKGDTGAAGKDGTNGTNGKDGIGCTIVKQTDTLATIKCGDSTMTLNFRGGGALVDTTSVDTLKLDSEKVAISLDSLSGYSQKGPFLKGTTVYLYELSDGRTLKQTNGNFTSEIKSDDGRYKFSSRNLVSQYALLVADGKYRNEVTGKPTNTAIKLQAYTNMLMRRSANVNLLTHLEKDRVYYLVTKEKKTVRAAKRQAQAEIFSAFHIDVSNFKTESEDLDVFGNTDADAALLAISILLQGDGDETALSVLLTEIADDMELDGEWNDAATKAAVADWAFVQDLSQIRKNVEGWGFHKGAGIGNFEQVIENFISQEFGVDFCGYDNDGDEYKVENKLSAFNGRLCLCKNRMLYIWSENKYFNDDIEYGMMLDKRDRHAYRTVKIGGQTWMAENLNYEYKVKPIGSDQYETYGNYCNSDDNCWIYGRYYTWAAAMDYGYGNNNTPTYPVRGICPAGWHLPDSSEWNVLYSAMGGDRFAMQAKGFANWPDATDAYGFSALPAGCYFEDRDCKLLGKVALFWSATESEYNADNWRLNASEASRDKYGADKRHGYSVRCVQD